MDYRVIRQPDGLYCIWNLLIEDFVVWDATADDVDTFIVTEAIQKAQDEAMKLIAQSSVTSENTLSDLLRSRQWLHGDVIPKNEQDEDFSQWLTKMGES